MVVMIVCVHVDDVTAAGEPEACDFLNKYLLDGFQSTRRGLSWYLGFAFERDRKKDVLPVS